MARTTPPLRRAFWPMLSSSSPSLRALHVMTRGSHPSHAAVSSVGSNSNNNANATWIQQQQRRWFESEGAYNQVADQTLEGLQDAVEAAMEGVNNVEAVVHVDDTEITLAAGVLMIQLPPHGTWVLNKQTPNRQIWWSSPLSGPKRFEYAEDGNLWFCTQNGLSLVPLLAQELSHVLKTHVELSVKDDA